jgi:hypothetical protein
MLKTNSKKAHENVRRYIMENFTPENYTDTPPTEWHEIAKFIYNTFRSEKWNCIEDYRYYMGNEMKAFVDWASGLPSVLDTCYYYNRSAVEDLGNILEQTIIERNRYEESEAEKMLSHLIYMELNREVKKHGKN